MTLFGTAPNWSATIRTAVRSSMLSPNEMTSLRPDPTLPMLCEDEEADLFEMDDEDDENRRSPKLLDESSEDEETSVDAASLITSLESSIGFVAPVAAAA